MEKQELELPGTMELCEDEMKEIQGGGLLSSLGIWGTIAASFISNFKDVRDGFLDGINGKPPRY